MLFPGASLTQLIVSISECNSAVYYMRISMSRDSLRVLNVLPKSEFLYVFLKIISLAKLESGRWVKEAINQRKLDPGQFVPALDEKLAFFENGPL